MKRTKRYQALLKQLTPQSESYNASDAAQLLKQNATTKFDETIDVAINLNLKKSQTIRDSIRLPHRFGKERKILVLARGDHARNARNAGATYVGDADYIQKIKDGWLDFDTVIATPDIMREIAPLGAILGRRGMMPNPKSGTVTMEMSHAIGEMKEGRREFRSDKHGVIHFSVAKASMAPEKIAENLQAAIGTITNCRPEGHKGEFIKSIFVSTTMGPSLVLSLQGGKE